MRGDVGRERLDEERFPDHDLVHGLPEQLREAAHVHAFLGGIQVDGAGDLGGERLLAACMLDADRLGDLAHPHALEAELHLGHGGLQVEGRIAASRAHLDMNRNLGWLVSALHGSSPLRATTCARL